MKCERCGADDSQPNLFLLCTNGDLHPWAGHRERQAPPAMRHESEVCPICQKRLSEVTAKPEEETMIPVGICRYCLKPEHPSGTICKQHPDLIPEFPVGCGGPFEDQPLIDGVQPKVEAKPGGGSDAMASSSGSSDRHSECVDTSRAVQVDSVAPPVPAMSAEQLEHARNWLANYRKPPNCIQCGEPINFILTPGVADYCKKAPAGTSGHQFDITIDSDAEPKMLVAYAAARLAEARSALISIASQTYGEAIKVYPWLRCQSHEWDNRTTVENTAYLVAEAQGEIERLRVQLAGCSVAALGGTKEPAQKDSYGWSPAYQDVLVLRLKFEQLEAALQTAQREQREKDAKELLCPVHFNLDKNDHLEPFDNCIACIRVERDELRSLLMRISTDCAQIAVEDPIKAQEGWVVLSAPVLQEIGDRACEYNRDAAIRADEEEKQMTAREFYEKNATNVVNVPRPHHPEDKSGLDGVRRASEARFVADDALVMTLADAFDFAEKYRAAERGGDGV